MQTGTAKFGPHPVACAILDDLVNAMKIANWLSLRLREAQLQKKKENTVCHEL